MRIAPSPAQWTVLDALIMGREIDAQPNTWAALRIRGWTCDKRSITPEGLLAMDAPNATRTTPAAVVQNLTRYGPASAEMLARRMRTHLPLLEQVLEQCFTQDLVDLIGPPRQYVAVGVTYPKTTWRFPNA